MLMLLFGHPEAVPELVGVGVVAIVIDIRRGLGVCAVVDQARRG